MHLFSTDCVVSREVQHLLDVGKLGDSGEKVTISSTESDRLRCELNAGYATD